mgnify:CR=1 FL=1
MCVGDLVTWRFDPNRVGIVVVSTLVPDPYTKDDLLLYRAVTVHWRDGFEATYFLSLPLTKDRSLQLLQSGTLSHE